MNRNLYFSKWIVSIFFFASTLYFFKTFLERNEGIKSENIITTLPHRDTLSSKIQPKENPNNIPDEVYNTLEYILKYQKPPDGYVGGRKFYNREKKLPLKDFTGQILSYKEWDIHPKSSHKTRGAERIITDSNLNAYYTKDHYKTFIKIKI